jgi:hypothetical protein
MEYLLRITNGSIFIITRIRSVAIFLIEKEVINLRAVLFDKAVKMLINRLETSDLMVNRSIILTLIDKLAYLSLTIV